MKTSDIHIEKLQSQLGEWKARVAKFEAKAASASADVQLGYLHEVDELKEKYSDAERQFNEVRKAQQNASSDMKDDMSSALRDLGAAVSKAASRFG